MRAFLLLLLVLSISGCSPWTRKATPQGQSGGSEQAVLVYLKLSGEGFGAPVERDRIFALEEELDAAIENAGAGEFDGNEFGGGECILFMYGPSADRLFQAVEPVLRASPSSRGGYAVKRYGEPGAREVRVELGNRNGISPSVPLPRRGHRQVAAGPYSGRSLSVSTLRTWVPAGSWSWKRLCSTCSG
jgi:hypothetical protein